MKVVLTSLTLFLVFLFGCSAESPLDISAKLSGKYQIVRSNCGFAPAEGILSVSGEATRLSMEVFTASAGGADGTADAQGLPPGSSIDWAAPLPANLKLLSKFDVNIAKDGSISFDSTYSSSTYKCSGSLNQDGALEVLCDVGSDMKCSFGATPVAKDAKE